MNKEGVKMWMVIDDKWGISGNISILRRKPIRTLNTCAIRAYRCT